MSGSRIHRSTTTRDRARARARRRNEACHICGKAIDYSLPWDNPRALVIDHVDALARGGADELTNMRAAHRDCNSTKRARAYAPIIRRSGALD